MGITGGLWVFEVILSFYQDWTLAGLEEIISKELFSSASILITSCKPAVRNTMFAGLKISMRKKLCKIRGKILFSL